MLGSETYAKVQLRSVVDVTAADCFLLFLDELLHVTLVDVSVDERWSFVAAAVNYTAVARFNEN